MYTLNGLLAVIKFHQYNLRILHWKVKGTNFDLIHSLTDDYISKFNEFIDLIAEIELTMGITPFNYEEISKYLIKNKYDSKLDIERDYTDVEAFKMIDEIFEFILDYISKMRSANKFPSFVESKLDDVTGWFELERNFKNKQRLK